MTPERAIRRIIICGGGTAGWMSAAALSRMLPAQEIAVTLVQSSDIGTVGVGEATIPPIVQFNRLLGIDEDEFLAATNATFKLGIEFVDWRRRGHTYMHPFGLFGADMHEVSFHHFWRRAVANGMSDAVMAFNAEMQLAYSGSAVRPAPPLNYAYQFDATAYGEYLRQYAVRNGVAEIEGKIASVERDDKGDIAAVVLDDGRRLEGDFFIDCTGFRALLIGQAMGAEFEDWSQWLPCNRALAMPSARTSEPFQFTRAAAQDWGWRWQIPLQHRTGNGMVYCDAFADEAEVEQALRDANRRCAARRSQSPSLHRPALRCAVDRQLPRDRPCLGLPRAARIDQHPPDPGGHIELHHDVPRPASRPVDGRALQSRRWSELQVGMRDFIIAHYKLTQRDDTPFWRHVSAMPIPDSLAERIELFERRGEVLAEHGDLFKEANWFAVLDGMGVRARSWHPAADLPPLEELRGRMDQIASLIAKRARLERRQANPHLDP